MSTVKKVLVALLLVVIAGSLVIVALVYKDKLGLGGAYYAVYLDTGDLYFGKLSRFPSLALTDVWYLERGAQQLSINDFSQIVWGPAGTLKLNDDRVVWVVKLSSQSQLLPYLKGELSAGNQAPAAAPETSPPSVIIPSTTTLPSENVQPQ
jgi:hypothetical protein